MDPLQQYLSNRVQEPVMIPPQILSVALEALETEGKRVEELKTQQAEIAASLRLSQHHIAAIRNLLTPIRRMPPETLTEIFLHYIQSGDGLDSQDSEKRRLGSLVYLPPALVLSQVCWSWRRIVETQPCLWAKLRFSIRKRFPDPELLSDWLRRSGSLPLDIDIRAVKYAYPKPSEDFLNTLLLMSVRWRSLQLKRFRMTDIDKILNQPAHDLHTPLLEEVALECDWLPDRSLSVIQNAPRLANFKIDSELEIGSSTHALHSLITHLNLACLILFPQDVLELLKGFHLLQECTLYLGDPPRLWEESSFEAIQLPHLRILRLKNFGRRQFLSRLQAPLLTDLTIEHNPDPQVTGEDLGTLSKILFHPSPICTNPISVPDSNYFISALVQQACAH
ncbi:hypothetical protein VKT23_007901 [Stygiomarasmius scandens]|uniref:F-box domain-containing protein n=1 Tax=Marasmiellus scandens TaxID=2682957 RepID=A0ABR1JJW8_9AGAR